MKVSSRHPGKELAKELDKLHSTKNAMKKISNVTDAIDAARNTPFPRDVTWSKPWDDIGPRKA